MIQTAQIINDSNINVFKTWQNDWNKFARDVLKVTLDKEQREILSAIQTHNMVSVVSGTARGKDFVAAVAAICFLYLTPTFEGDKLTGNTKVALTAPTGRQVENIMFPEISRIFQKAKVLPGRLVSNDIRTDFDEWFLTGFKADEHNHEAWSGFHAVNTMFVVTEASGITEDTFNAIEGNLQGNSKILIVFNPNNSTGYAARSQRSPRWKKFRLDDLTAPNVIEKRQVIPGQVDYDWVKDKVITWCDIITQDEMDDGKGDFEFEGYYYRPNDLFRIKVRGMFPEVGEDVLIPLRWIELANARWKKRVEQELPNFLRLGVDVAGMGRDSSVLCRRYNAWVAPFEKYQSAGKADHMKVAGMVVQKIKPSKAKAFIDTIGEGAGVYSRLIELNLKNKAFSCKFSESAEDLTDITEQFEFANMKAYLYWAVRDWLDPRNNTGAALPPDDEFTQETAEIKWQFQSNGKIIMEKKEDMKKRLGRSPDKFDSLANTFYPEKETNISDLNSVLGMLP